MNLALRKSENPFEQIRHQDEQGEYWLATEFLALFGYKSMLRASAIVTMHGASTLALIQGRPTAHASAKLPRELMPKLKQLWAQRKGDRQMLLGEGEV